MIGMFRYLTGIQNADGKRDEKKLAASGCINAAVEILGFIATLYFIMVIREGYISEEVFRSPVSIFIVYVLFLEALSVVKTIIELYRCKVFNRFIYNGAHELSLKVFELFAKEDLKYHNEKSGMQALTMVRTDTLSCIRIIPTCIETWENIFILFGYIIGLICISKWIGVVGSVILITLMVWIFRKLRIQIDTYGERAREYDMKTNVQIGLTYGIFEEMKLSGRVKTILGRYHRVGSKYAGANSDFAYKRGIMNLLMKFSGKVVLAAVVVLLFLSDRSPEAVLVLFAVYVAAFGRIVPVAYSIMNSMSGLEFSKKSYGFLKENLVRYEQMKEEEKSGEYIRKKELTFRSGLSVRSLSFGYHDQMPIFENASIDIPMGHSVAVIGVSGAGKTTLLALIMGLLTPWDGSILYDDYDIVSHRDANGSCQANLGDIISYIPQTVYLNGETIRHNIAFFEEENEIIDKKVEECLRCAQIWEDIEKMPEGMNTLIGERGTTISGGQRQRLALARALYKEFELLIMDEATAALDIETEKAVIDSIRQVKKDKTILIVTHHISLANECDMIYKIENKKIVRVK